MKYLKNKKTILKLRDMAIAMEYGTVKADQRIQVKMPGIVVEELDRLFGNVDRSKLLTQLALGAILQQYRYLDRPELYQLEADSQHNLNDMWDYLEKRDAKKL